MPTTPTTFGELVDFFLGFINILIPALFAVLLGYIFWKILDAWVINAADETKRAEGKSLVVVAVIVLVLMLTSWGIVALIRNSLF